MADTFLERIVATTQQELSARQQRVPLEALRERAATAPAPRRFAEALRPTPAGSARLIAEVKRASPSKGLLAESFDPVAQAQAYTAGGAVVISVLTEPRYFLGSLEHLTAVRAAVDVPVLRKDFILDPYQVYEARAAGADALLLICALLDDAHVRDLLALTRTLGMEALVEAHNAEETRRAVACGATVIGVNSRDLRSFTVDTAIVQHLRPLVPMDRVFVAESGIGDATGAARARAWGADAILVGEALMRALDPTAKAHELVTAPGGATAALFARSTAPWVKICGLARSEHVSFVRELGADVFGLVFAPQAPAHRRVTPEQAHDLTISNSPHSSPLRGGEPSPPLPGSPFPAGTGRQEMRPVGVFVNEPAESIDAIAKLVGLGAIQLSGDETPEHCGQVAEATGLPVIKALRLGDEADLERLDAYALAGATLLLDAYVPGSYGGTGRTSDWELARRAAERWPVILSGGLTPDNVADAIAAVRPFGVDVSSGVETDQVKDPEKIRAFVKATRATRSAIE